MIISTVDILDIEIDFDPSPTEMDTIPILSHCDVDFARTNGGDYVNHVIDVIRDTNAFNMDKVKLHFLNQRLTKGSYSICPGWHVDWYTHFNQKANPSKHSVSIFTFGEDICQTDFYLGELPSIVLGDGNMDPEEFWFFRNHLVDECISTYNADVISMPPNTIFRMNPHTMHRPTAATRTGKRILVKIEESDTPASNRILNTSTVYMPFDSMKFQGEICEYL